MGKFSKLLLGTALFGVAAAGVYEYLKQTSKESAPVPEGPAADRRAESAEAEAEAVDAEAEAAEAETAKADAEVGEDKAEANGAEAQEGAGRTLEEQVQEFAERAYTTIKTGAGEAADKVRTEVWPKVREKIGPKGEDILHVMGETAVHFKDTAVDSAGQVRDILSREERSYSTVDTSCREKDAEGENTQESAEAADDVMRAVRDAVKEAAEDDADSAAEPFFDDSQNL